MSSVNNIGSTPPIRPITSPTVQKPVQAEAPAHTPVADRVELSGVSHLVAIAKQNNIRTDKVAAVKAQIQAGTYEDDKKLDIATGKLLDDLLK
jgi:anti-sigma28 factor (negative regulator of flagellin synthesis)